MAGCNLKCPFCHNPELSDISLLDNSSLISEDNFFEFLASRPGLIEGVCVSGGEPTFSPDLPEFLKKIKEKKFLVKLDTNGLLPNILENLIKERLVDYIAMDIKAPLERYKEFFGNNLNLENIHKSTELVRGLNDYEFRTTVVPSIHDKKDIISIARWLQGSKKYYLQQFRPEKTLDSNFLNINPYSEEKLIEFCNLCRPYFDVCELRL